MTTINWEKKGNNISEEQKTLALQKIQEALAGFSSTAKKEILDELSVATSAEIKTEKESKYVELQPTGFTNAPQSAKQKRQELVDEEDTEKLKWIHDNVSYNTDHTMNIIKLKKTFCEDVSWQDKIFTWEQAKELEKNNTGWYKLMTDYNNCDADKKEQTDWYKVINIFSNGNGDIVEGRELFRDMAWCNYRYWTATVYKGENWVENNDLVLTRYLFLKDLYKHWSRTYNDFRVCGLKDMNVTA